MAVWIVLFGNDEGEFTILGMFDTKAKADAACAAAKAVPSFDAMSDWVEVQPHAVA